MAQKNPKLIKVEEDFEKIEKVINLESKKTKRIEKILNSVALYPVNPDSACTQMYRLYGLRSNIYPHPEIMAKLKDLIRKYSPKVLLLLKSQSSPTLFKI